VVIVLLCKQINKQIQKRSHSVLSIFMLPPSCFPGVTTLGVFPRDSEKERFVARPTQRSDPQHHIPTLVSRREVQTARLRFDDRCGDIGVQRCCGHMIRIVL
jgi:hypothetical protein